MALITVITPTYNRAARLEELFQSLCCQTSRNFEWLVVDDGSTDDTAQMVQEMTGKAGFPVRYIYKENGGKHTALNVGIREINTELTFIVDSDDAVLPHGIELIEAYYQKYKDDDSIGVWAFLKQTRSRGIILRMPEDEYVGDYIEERIHKRRPGDMAEVFRTQALREFPFPEFPGERFLSEDVVWIPLAMKYRSVFINKAIYLFEYLPDGLTNNDKVLKFASPLGSMMRGKMLMKKECGMLSRVRGAIIYTCYKKEVIDAITPCVELTHWCDKFMAALLAPLGAYYYKKWKNRQ